MKKFKDFIRESDLISLGGSASNRTGRWGQEPVHMGVHRIEDPNVLQRLNAHVGLVNTREYIDPRSALEHVQNALMRLGYHFDYNLNDMPNEQNVYPLRRFGGRQGFLDMDAEIKEDDGIENSVGERLVLNMEFFQDPDSSRYEVMAQIVPASLFDEEEVQPEAIRPNRASVASTTGDRDGLNMGEARELDIDKMTRTLVKKTDDGRWQVFVWSPKVKQMIPQGQPFKSRQAAEKDARKFHEQVMNEDVSRTFAFPTADARDRMEKLLGLAGKGGVSTSDKGKGKMKFTVTSVLKAAQLDRIMNSVQQLKGKLAEGSPADIANDAVRQAIQERAELQEADVFKKHQLKIARDTLKMNPVFRKVMGGPSREEAIQILLKHGSAADKKMAQRELGEAKDSGEFTAVAIKNNKVVGQISNLEKRELATASDVLKKQYPGSKISIENKSGRVVKVEAKDPNKLLEGVQVFPAEPRGRGSWNVEAAFGADDWKGPLSSAVRKEIKKAGWKSFDIREDKTIRVVVMAQSDKKAQKQVSDLVAKARKSVGLGEDCDLPHDENAKELRRTRKDNKLAGFKEQISKKKKAPAKSSPSY